MIRALTYRRKS